MTPPHCLLPMVPTHMHLTLYGVPTSKVMKHTETFLMIKSMDVLTGIPCIKSVEVNCGLFPTIHFTITPAFIPCPFFPDSYAGSSSLLIAERVTETDQQYTCGAGGRNRSTPRRSIYCLRLATWLICCVSKKGHDTASCPGEGVGGGENITWTYQRLRADTPRSSQQLLAPVKKANEVKRSTGQKTRPSRR